MSIGRLMPRTRFGRLHNQRDKEMADVAIEEFSVD